MLAYLGSFTLSILATFAAWGPDALSPQATFGLPEPGKSVGVAITNTPGRWMVVKAAPFELVTDIHTVTTPSHNYIFWQGTEGVYTAVLIPVEQSAPLEFATVTLGKGSGPGPDPNPNPQPNPDPQPPPGPRLVMVIEEKDQRTPAIALTQQRLREYCAQKGHTWTLLDDDTVDQTGRRSERLQFFLSEMLKSNITTPALVVSVQYQGKEHFSLSALPSDPAQAIAIVQKYGG